MIVIGIIGPLAIGIEQLVREAEVSPGREQVPSFHPDVGRQTPLTVSHLRPFHLQLAAGGSGH